MNNYPLIKFVLIFICGYLFQTIFHLSGFLLLCLTSLFFIILLILYFTKNQRLSLLNQCILFLTIFFVSGFYYSSFHTSKVSYPFKHFSYQNIKVYGKVTNIELIKENRLVFYLISDSIIFQNYVDKREFNFQCLLNDSQKRLEGKYDSLKIGSSVEINGNISRPRNKRNPGEFDYENYLNQKQIHALLSIKDVSNIKIISNSSFNLANIIFGIRKKIDNVFSKYHNKNTASLLRGLLLADRSMIDYEIKNEFINSGVVHVLAVSGLHVGFISLIFIFLFQRLNIFLKYSFTIIGLILFMILTNAPPSVVRATIMCIVIILSLMSGRKYNSFNAIALAAFIILLINPDELFNSGFQLSFAAVISILIFYPVLRNSIQQLNIKSNILKNILLFIALSLAAQIGTIPFVLIYFNKLSIISLIANLIVIPLVGIIIGLGIFTLIISLISSLLCSYYASANELLTYILFFVTNKFGNLSIAYLPVANFSIIDIINYYISIAAIIFLWKRFQSIKAKIITLVLIALNFFIWSKLDDVKYLPDNSLSIMAIDVGQGDSYLIKFPDGQTALIDAGNANKYFDNGKRIIMPLIEYLGIKKIDYAFVSHIDSDHYRGFLSLIRNNKIKFVYKPPLDSLDKEDKNFEAFLNHFSIPYKYYSKNMLSIGGVRIYILSDSFNYDNSNDRSGVLKIKYGNTSFLFTGDISRKAEIGYVNKYNKFLKSDLLKVSHHGSKTGTSNIFLNYVEPKYAVISAGISNIFHHPDKDVIERLTKRGIKIFRTDKEGAILFQSNGNNIQNINWKKLDNNFIF